jgi:UDP-glucose 4-epimerase
LLAIPHSWQVIALYRPGDSGFQRFLATHRLSHVQGVACDLTDRQQVALVAARWGRNFQGCLAFASNTSIPLSIEQPVYDLTTNAIGLLHLLEYCSFEHLVYLSSGAVYVGLTGLVGPGSAVAPHLPYAISKMAAELYIRSFALHRQTPERATIVRFFGAYGPYEPARKLYTKLVRRFAFERDPHFTVIGDGENYIDAMYVGDAVKALMAVLARPPEEGIRCIDLGLGSGESINQIVTRAAHTFGLEPQISHEGSVAEYIHFVIDPHSFATLYQFMPTITLEDGLQMLAAHLKQEEAQAHG